MNICVSCKHHSFDDLNDLGKDHFCLNPRLSQTDRVTGKKIYFTCDWLRNTRSGQCGRNGKFWETK